MFGGVNVIISKIYSGLVVVFGNVVNIFFIGGNVVGGFLFGGLGIGGLLFLYSLFGGVGGLGG